MVYFIASEFEYPFVILEPRALSHVPRGKFCGEIRIFPVAEVCLGEFM